MELLENDYGMIDRIINSGDRRKEEEEKKGFVMDKIQKKKKEAAVATETNDHILKKDCHQDYQLE